MFFKKFATYAGTYCIFFCLLCQPAFCFDPNPTSTGSNFTAGLATAYQPAPADVTSAGGNNPTMEGGTDDRVGRPIYGYHTFEDYHDGAANSNGEAYVAVAMDSSSPFGVKKDGSGNVIHDGAYLTSPQYPGTVFKVVDTGGAFNGAGTSHVDIAYRDPDKAKTGSKENIDFTVISEEEAKQIAGNRVPGQKGIEPPNSTNPDIENNPSTQNSMGGKRQIPFTYTGYIGTRVINPASPLDKGVDPNQVNYTLDSFTDQALTAIDNSSCSSMMSSTYGHDTQSLKKEWVISLEGCNLYIRYKGKGKVIGELFFEVPFPPYCYPLRIISDEIEYLMLTSFSSMSRKQLTDLLRIHPSFAGSSGTGGKTQPSSTPKPGSGTNSTPKGDEPILPVFTPAFEQCVPGCSYGSEGIWGDKRHQALHSCHNSGSAIDVSSITCGGVQSSAGSAKFGEFVNCMRQQPSLFTIFGSGDHTNHAHFAIHDCETEGEGKVKIT